MLTLFLINARRQTGREINKTSYQTQGARKWWANCAWCAFGLASMLAPLKTTIFTRSGAIGKELKFEVQENDLVNVDECCAHFSVPPSKWCNDVKFACGTIHMFSSRPEALAWPEKGECLDIRTLWELSKVPYTICITLLQSLLTIVASIGITINTSMGTNVRLKQKSRRHLPTLE
jgi:hypothetical protein